MLEQIIKDLDEHLLQKEDIEKNLDKLKARQIEVDERIKHKKENPPEERLKATAEVPSRKVSILDRLGPKALPDHQKVDSWTNERFLKIKEPADQKSRDHRFITNFVANTLSAHQKEISRDAEKLEHQRALEKELEYKYTEEYRLEKESKEIVTSLVDNEKELVNVNKKIEELKEQLKNQKQLDREAALSNFCKTNTKPSIYFRPAIVDDWVTKKFGLKVFVETTIEKAETTGKKTTRDEKDERENKDDEKEKEREPKKRKVEEIKDDVDASEIIGVYRRSEKKESKHESDDEIQIIEVRPASKDNDSDFSINVGEGGRTFIK